MELEPDGIVPPDSDLQAPPHPVIAEIERLLDDAREDEALARIDSALAEGLGNPLDLHFLAGDALLALGRPVEAEQRFRQVLAADPRCPASRCWLGMALYRQCRFDEALIEAERARSAPDAVVDAHVVYGLLLERQGRFEEADACFLQAHEMEPAKYAAPVRLRRNEFDREVRRAAGKLPRQFRQHLERVPVVVHDLPEETLLRRDDGEVLDPDLLGLFEGTPLADTDSLDFTPGQPNYIYLFQRNLERLARDRADLVEQIRITLYHELGHYLGFEEGDMDDLGLA